MKIKQYQVDAFASRVFEGNPAAVCPLDIWLPDELLQAIAEENNLSETAFFVPAGKGFYLRWFTPVSEVDLCGHGTLATAHVILNILGHAGERVDFETRSGPLSVVRDGELLAMDFPAQPPQPCETPRELVVGLGAEPVEVLVAGDYIAVFDNEEAVRDLAPDIGILRELALRGVCVTAPGNGTDFVSRFFAPKEGIPEDPVCGSAHCELTPYWASRLGKKEMQARQISKRGGDVRCRLMGERVILSGQAVTFMAGEIEVAD
jgi:PhzF family phenazine biosynthesis protein